MSAPGCMCESADAYVRVIARHGRHRVILCRDGIQWIIQRRKSGVTGRWKALSYCTTRAALIRLWPTSEGPVPPEIAALPEKIRRPGHGESV